MAVREQWAAYLMPRLVPIGQSFGRAALREDFGEVDDMDAAAIRARAAHIIALGNEPDPETGQALRYYQPPPGAWPHYPAFAADLQQRMGLMVDAAEQIAVLAGGMDEPELPPPEPPPADIEDWTVLLDGAPGLVGRAKWLQGSTGSDLFVARGTVVRAPHACTVRFQGVPVPGIGTIGEMVLTYPDARAVRYRHVAQPRVSQGAAVARGAALCIVWDDTMDRLRWPPGYPSVPDGFQHLDLSLATQASRLNPQGGAGGDVDTFDHVWTARGGLPNFQVIDRTPGPLEGSRGALRAAWQAWAGQ